MFAFKKIYDIDYDEIDESIQRVLLAQFPMKSLVWEIVFNIPIGIAMICLEIFKIFHQLNLSYLGTGLVKFSNNKYKKSQSIERINV